MVPTEAVRTVTLRFYQALDDLLLSKGTSAMSEIWHHEDFVSTVHPFGHWAIGWNEVWATWQEVAAVFGYYRGHVGRKDGIGNIHGLRVAVLGDAAYTVGVYKSLLYLEGREVPLSVNCTNVLQMRSGQWKIVHHHPDQAPPEYQVALGRLVEASSSPAG